MDASVRPLRIDVILVQFRPKVIDIQSVKKKYLHSGRKDLLPFLKKLAIIV